MDFKPVGRTLAEGWRALTRDQKISVGVLGIIGLTAFGLTLQRVGGIISDPFTVSKQKLDAAKAAMDKINPAKRLEEEQKRRDTDGDGISDYEEDQVLGTSPYLRDTDGDGSPDNVELALGQNPNCAAGKPCFGVAIDVSRLASSTVLDKIEAEGGSTDDLIAAFQRGMNDSRRSIADQTGSTSTILQEALVRDAKEIRKALLESGKVDVEFVNQLSDVELLKLYDEAALEAAQQEAQQAGSKAAAKP